MPSSLDVRDPFTRDLIALLALPFVWRDLSPAAIAEQLIDVCARILRPDACGVVLTASGRIVLDRPLPTDRVSALEIAVDREGIQLSFSCACAREGFPSAAERALVRAAVDQAWLSIRMSVLTEEERSASESKDRFLAVLSHELRTPLNAILGWSAMLRRGSVAPERIAKAVETIDRNARAQAKLVDELLDVSRIVYGKIDLEIAEIDVASLLALTLESLRPSATESGIALVLESDVAPIVRGEAERLQQVFANLVSNAIKFTPSGGRVTVSIAEDRSTCSISIVDTGRGIEPEMLAQLFDPFRQRDRGDARAGGLGLGLAITKRLVELHGGTIQASSDGPGRGASFVVVLPRIAQRIASLPIRALPEASVSLRGVRVLVVEDHDDSREVVAGVLAIAGADVDEASSVDAALERVREHAPAVVICDIEMPLRTGYDFVRELRARPEHAAIRVIALTAQAHREDRERALRAGFDDYVPKPLEQETLLRAIAAQLARDA